MSDGLRATSWPRHPGKEPSTVVAQLYEPALAAAISYDRAAGFFGSSVLAACARGFGRFLERLRDEADAFPKPSIRVVTSVELEEADVRALLEAHSQDGLTREMLRVLAKPREAALFQRLKVLAWLYREGHLDMRVGVLRRGEGMVHAKFGLFTDAHGDTLFFHGSNNETAKGLSGNYEQVEVGRGWEDGEGLAHWRAEFDALWGDRHSVVRTVDLPTAVREKLISFAPANPPDSIMDAEDLEYHRAAARLAFLRVAPLVDESGEVCDETAPVQRLWPHQRKVIREAEGAWPDGRLLCDEVGMGKTIEGALIVRRILLRGKGRRALLLVPAGLRAQWQAELREKAGLWVPYFDPKRARLARPLHQQGHPV